jgi:hypothetical protein
MTRGLRDRHAGRRTDDARHPRAGGRRAKAGSGPKGTVKTASFETERLQFMALNGAACPGRSRPLELTAAARPPYGISSGSPSGILSTP